MPYRSKTWKTALKWVSPTSDLTLKGVCCFFPSLFLLKFITSNLKEGGLVDLTRKFNWTIPPTLLPSVKHFRPLMQRKNRKRPFLIWKTKKHIYPWKPQRIDGNSSLEWKWRKLTWSVRDGRRSVPRGLAIRGSPKISPTVECWLHKHGGLLGGGWNPAVSPCVRSLDATFPWKCPVPGWWPGATMDESWDWQISSSLVILSTRLLAWKETFVATSA